MLGTKGLYPVERFGRFDKTEYSIWHVLYRLYPRKFSKIVMRSPFTFEIRVFWYIEACPQFRRFGVFWQIKNQADDFLIWIGVRTETVTGPVPAQICVRPNGTRRLSANLIFISLTKSSTSCSMKARANSLRESIIQNGRMASGRLARLGASRDIIPRSLYALEVTNPVSPAGV